MMTPDELVTWEWDTDRMEADGKLGLIPWLDHLRLSPYCGRKYPGTFWREPGGGTRLACPCGWVESTRTDGTE